MNISRREFIAGLAAAVVAAPAIGSAFTETPIQLGVRRVRAAHTSMYSITDDLFIHQIDAIIGDGQFTVRFPYDSNRLTEAEITYAVSILSERVKIETGDKFAFDVRRFDYFDCADNLRRLEWLGIGNGPQS